MQGRILFMKCTNPKKTKKNKTLTDFCLDPYEKHNS